MKTLKFLTLILIAAMFAAPAFAQQPLDAKYPTGLVVPKDLDQRIKTSWQKYGRNLQALPVATEAAYICPNLQPVENQGSCGSCWDFSGSDACGMALLKAGKIKADDLISKQYTLDCYNNGGCNGGWPEEVTKHAKSVGLPLASVYGPYKAREGSCKSIPAESLLKIVDYGYVGSESGVPPTQAIKDAMVKFGPISVAVAADSSFNNVGPSTIISGSNGGINHAVILIGWDDAKSAWKMRNSWGTSWGDGGNCWIKYGAKSIGYGAMWVNGGEPLPPVPPVPSGAPAITSSLSVSAQKDAAFSYRITATNNPILFHASPLPSGLSVDTTNGTISGTPTTLGTTTVTLIAANASGLDQQKMTLAVIDVPVPPVPPGPTPATGFTGTVTTVYKNGVVVNVTTGPAGDLEGDLKAAGVSPNVIADVLQLLTDLKNKAPFSVIIADVLKIASDFTASQPPQPTPQSQRMPIGSEKPAFATRS